jgi:hypothetical protein
LADAGGDPADPSAAVRDFVAIFESARPDVEEVVTADKLVRRGVLSQTEADEIATQAERFAAAAILSGTTTGAVAPMCQQILLFRHAGTFHVGAAQTTPRPQRAKR